MGIMSTLCLVWGFQQIAIKACADDMAPLLQIAVRSAGAALLLALWMQRRGERLHWQGGRWRAGLLVGGLFGVEFLLVGEALRLTSAAHTVVFLYTAPVFAAIGLAVVQRNERLQPLQWLGIGIAFGGLALAFLGGDHPPGSSLAGDALALLAGLCWGATTVAVRATWLAQATPGETLQWQLLGAALLGGLGAGLLGQTAVQPSGLLALSLLFQAVVVAFASYLLWFWLLRQYLASRLGVFSFLTPLAGVGFGVLLLGERLEPVFGLGAAGVLAGIALVSWRP